MNVKADSRKPVNQPSDQLAAWARREVGDLAARYLADVSSAVRDLAMLRRIGATAPAFGHEAWRMLVDLPASLQGRGDVASRGERAAIATLALFARHQQSHRDRSMQQATTSLAQGLQRLATESRAEKALTRRFNALLSAQSFDSLTWHLRALLAQLRTAPSPIPIDYGGLARDLYLIQDPRRADGVRLRWSRDFYVRGRNPNDTDAPPSVSTETIHRSNEEQH